MPAFSDSFGFPSRSGSPSTCTAPSVGGVTPVRIFTSVDFPAPFAPTSPRISPRRSASGVSRSATTPPYSFVSPAASSQGGSGSAAKRAPAPQRDPRHGDEQDAALDDRRDPARLVHDREPGR